MADGQPNTVNKRLFIRTDEEISIKTVQNISQRTLNEKRIYGYSKRRVRERGRERDREIERESERENLQREGEGGRFEERERNEGD